jgi:hypothetical protein
VIRKVLLAVITLASVSVLALAYVNAGGEFSLGSFSISKDAPAAMSTQGDESSCCADSAAATPSAAHCPDCYPGCCPDCPPCDACPLGIGSGATTALKTASPAITKPGGCCANKQAASPSELTDR